MNKLLFSLAKSPLGELIVGIAFGKLSGLLPVKRVRETELVVAFHHPKPYWENHILLVPKRAIKNLAALNDEDVKYIEDIFRVAREIVRENNWQETDYTIITNGGQRQEVAQIHFHLGSGKILS